MKTFRFLLIAVICILAGGRGIALGQCVPPPSGMVAWWPLDETSSPANDLAGVNNTGTWMNNPTPVSGKVAGALSFNGTNYVAAATHAELNLGTGSFSIDTWVKRDTASTNSPPSMIVDKRDVNDIGYALGVSYGRLVFRMCSTNYATTTYPVPADDQWHHVAVTVNRSTNVGRFYSDGIPLDMFTPPPCDLNNTNPLLIGAGYLGGNQPWLGCIDELEIFNRELDSTEVQAIFNADSLGKCKPDTCHANGDANNDAVGLTSADLAYLDMFINGPGPAPVPLYSCDLNGDGYINPADLQLYQDYFVYGISVFDPYGGYPVPCPCDPIAQPVPDTVNIYGLEHTSLGMACLETVDDTLKLGRLGSSGHDGVMITLPESDFLEVSFDSSYADVDGASLDFRSVGDVNGVPDQDIVFGHMRRQGGNWHISADFSPLGETTYSIIVLDRDSLVNVFSGLELVAVTSSDPASLTFGPCHFSWINPSDSCHNGTEPIFMCTNYGYPHCWFVSWFFPSQKLQDCCDTIAGVGGNIFHSCGYPGTMIIHLPGSVEIWIGSSVMVGDELIISPPDPNLVGKLSEVEIIGTKMSNLNITGEALGFSLLPHRTLGQATFTEDEGALVISNIGTSGEDGVAVDLGDVGAWDGYWFPIDFASLPSGAFLQTNVLGTVDGVPHTVVSDTRIEKSGDSTLLRTSFSGIGATMLRFDFFRQDSLVDSLNNQPNGETLCMLPTGPQRSTDAHWSYIGPTPASQEGNPCGTTGPGEVMSYPCLFAGYTFPDNNQFSFPSLGVVLADEVRVYPEDHTADSLAGPLSLMLRLASIPSITLVTEQVYAIPPANCCQGLRGNVNGDPNNLVTVSDVVYLINYLFRGGAVPPCMEEADANGDGKVTVSDVIYLINYLFKGGPPPVSCDP